ncbi:MAG: leucine--tRNA ligase [Oscillospiraceae bacterium]|nr:leucine--tRNA ligase [Oscillospiraceae bacterium]
MKYEFKEIETKWQKYWVENKTYQTSDESDKPKFYGLIEFPFPSGQGLHVGHARPYTAMDAIARKKRMEGYNVLFPMGYDAFGLPTENYAIQNHVHPRAVTERNVGVFRGQLQELGYSFDWDREVNTTDPGYYKWTQWIFLQLFKHGLAYKAKMPVNWCTSCKCVLANEEVVEGLCERCGAPVVRKERSQWILRITKYADRLIDDLEDVNFPDRVKTQQINWIGRSYGAQVKFSTTLGDEITVYTTRPDTLFGATYMVLSPEHALIETWKDKLTNLDEVRAYQAMAASKSDMERTELNKDKTGVRLGGVMGINPVNGKEIPIFISDYVLATYGTGAIMAVPAHDTRDWEFAKKFGLPIVEVIAGGNVEEAAFTDVETGILVNSDFLNGLSVAEAKTAITNWLVEHKLGEAKKNFKLRDWVFSRQRYWGDPIPIIICPNCGFVPMDEKDLPLLLPDVESYELTDDGESPLASIPEFVNTTCPCCGGPARRETDTMPQWAGSNWYYLRYTDPHNDKALASREALERWTPVDWYNGGMEHTTLHLLYSRFWHKFLYDIGVVPTREPYAKRTSHGMILGEGGIKMSKSRGNVINPSDVIKEYGADTMRTYIMFIGDFEKPAAWAANSVKGCKRFLDKIWALAETVEDAETEYSKANENLMHKTIRKVTSDIDQLKANTALAQLMTLVNQLGDKGCNRAELKTLLALVSPFAPHIAEELWQQKGFEGLCSLSAWPQYDEEKCKDQELTIAIQVNGKTKGTIQAPADLSRDELAAYAQADEWVQKAVARAGSSILKTIAVPNKLVNLIVK